LLGVGGSDTGENSITVLGAVKLLARSLSHSIHGQCISKKEEVVVVVEQHAVVLCVCTRRVFSVWRNERRLAEAGNSAAANLKLAVSRSS